MLIFFLVDAATNAVDLDNAVGTLLDLVANAKVDITGLLGVDVTADVGAIVGVVVQLLVVRSQLLSLIFIGDAHSYLASLVETRFRAVCQGHPRPLRHRQGRRDPRPHKRGLLLRQDGRGHGRQQLQEGGQGLHRRRQAAPHRPLPS